MFSAVLYSFALLAIAVAFPEVYINGREESPIDIVTSRLVSDKPNTLLIKNRSTTQGGYLTNTGHTVRFEPTSQTPFQIVVGGQNYKVCEVHFHWGPKSTQRGSEHTVNGIPYAGEAHIVSIRENYRCEDLKSMQSRGSVVVIGVFLKAGYSTNPLWKILSPVPIKYEKKEKIYSYQLSYLLPNNPEYYSYEGSLTTGKYKEIVQWFVFRNPIDVPELYLSQLRSIVNEEGYKTTSNFRGVQPLYGRRVRMGSAVFA